MGRTARTSSLPSPPRLTGSASRCWARTHCEPPALERNLTRLGAGIHPTVTCSLCRTQQCSSFSPSPSPSPFTLTLTLTLTLTTV
eukprot:scaffold39831_cov58-Phaeocystis_antarctica.AAC.3